MSIYRQKIENLTRAELKQQIKQNQGWYFITFVRDLPHNRPYGFTLYDQPFVLLRNKTGKLFCYLLLLADEINSDRDFGFQSFPVVEKQQMIWFWYKKNIETDHSLIPSLTDLNKFIENQEF